MSKYKFNKPPKDEEIVWIKCVKDECRDTDFRDNGDHKYNIGDITWILKEDFNGTIILPEKNWHATNYLKEAFIEVEDPREVVVHVDTQEKWDEVYDFHNLTDLRNESFKAAYRKNIHCSYINIAKGRVSSYYGNVRKNYRNEYKIISYEEWVEQYRDVRKKVSRDDNTTSTFPHAILTGEEIKKAWRDMTTNISSYYKEGTWGVSPLADVGDIIGDNTSIAGGQSNSSGNTTSWLDDYVIDRHHTPKVEYIDVSVRLGAEKSNHKHKTIYVKKQKDTTAESSVVKLKINKVKKINYGN